MMTALPTTSEVPGVEGPKNRPYSDCRGTAIEGVQQLPEHWEEQPLKHAVAINPDKLADKTDPDFELEYVDVGDVSLVEGIGSSEKLLFADAPSRARRCVRDGDSIISTVRTYLKAVARIVEPPDNLIVSTGFAVLRPSERVDPGYLFRVVQSHAFVDRVVAYSTGVSYPAINPTDMGRLPIPLPPLDEQRQIAAFLDRETAKIDELVAKKRRLIELLKEKRTALISHAVTKGLDPDAEMKDSAFPWFGAIPRHWQTKRLKHISPGQTVGCVINPSTYFVDSGVPFLLGNNVDEGRLKLENVRYVNEESNLGPLRKSRVFEGDIVVVRVGDPGVAVVIPSQLDGCNVASMMIVRRSASFDSFWMEYAFNSQSIRDQVDIVKYGAAQKQFNIGHAIDFWFAVPPLDEQRELVRFIRSEISRFDDLVARVSEGIAALREYRSALISAAVTGKIDVRAT